MDEFVIEKYIEISIGISISTAIVYADPDPHFYSVTIRRYDREHVHIFIAPLFLDKTQFIFKGTMIWTSPYFEFFH